MTKFTTETDARPMPPASSGSPIHASGAAVEGPRPSGAGSPIRTCACGCGRSLEGRRANTKYALTACRVRHHRKRYTSVTNPIAEPKTPKRSSGPSGLQVSYAKAVRTLIADYRGLNLPNAEKRAVEMVRGMLSDRQRARLDERRTG